MDISSPINTQSLLAANRLLENTLNLKVGQQLDVKVLNANIQATKNAITLSLGEKNVTVQSNQPVALNSGQNLKIQVTQVAPVVEFKVLNPLPELKNQAVELRLKLIPTARDGGNGASSQELMRPTARNGGNIANNQELMRSTTARDAGNAVNSKEVQQPSIKDGASAKELIRAITADGGKAQMLSPIKDGVSAKDLFRPIIGENNSSPVKLLLDAKIVNIAGNKIQLQVDSPAASGKQTALITIDRTQLTNAPSNLKAGQSLNLEIVRNGATTEFKIIPNPNNISEEKIAEFTKQFLPRHEASPIFLNQLVKDLPRLLKNESVPQALKDIAVKIIQNLPPKEQLITSQGLKQAITNSGLFLEAKLAPPMSQTELIKELPGLVKNESVPQSLQRIAAEILQNLTQKQPSPDPGIEQPAANSQQPPEPEQASLKSSQANNADNIKDSLPQPSTSSDSKLVADDFKGNLLKFIQALKQEITHQSEQPSNQVDLDLLKNLQNKTENTVAKLVLDQLTSLPKEDAPKQLWVIDIPFIDRQQAESVRIEVQQDKRNKQQAGNSDWSVNITVTPPGLGTIHCIVSYRNDVINTFFKSQNTKTTELIKHNLDYLKNQLEDSGLKTGHMDAHDGAEKIMPTPPNQLAGKKLFDDKA
ncbi:flagellar hook-length control protein FliK [Candidatus Methylobacter oryzae]|uniref:Flagellar hook-length control protein FliK n=1 Tax=Candidatus Methylobacter oryzae TaxID=2497749 RepID=A0ABY3CBT9_9GAMM|nr:flagellar hook-length control protein FliK [Candidatus Methylobacter oryzae]TRW96099.1 flagellar hook-length control protein FliK [Candidatus Methylobacter oryzae]